MMVVLADAIWKVPLLLLPRSLTGMESSTSPLKSTGNMRRANAIRSQISEQARGDGDLQQHGAVVLLGVRVGEGEVGQADPAGVLGESEPVDGVVPPGVGQDDKGARDGRNADIAGARDADSHARDDLGAADADKVREGHVGQQRRLQGGDLRLGVFCAVDECRHTQRWSWSRSWSRSWWSRSWWSWSVVVDVVVVVVLVVVVVVVVVTVVVVVVAVVVVVVLVVVFVAVVVLVVLVVVYCGGLGSV
jgi:hypothetical protein